MHNKIQQIVAEDFARLNAAIVEQLHSQVPLIENIGHYITEAGGKRIRPVLSLLSARALGYEGQGHVTLATVIEFIHTATLLHDDVVDMSEMRRGRPTANTRWDNPSSVLVGDFIYSRAFELLVALGDMGIMAVMASTTNRISEGEVLQLVNQHNPATSEADYLRVINDKTAILFAAACRSAALLAGAPAALQNTLHDYGLAVGLAFQLIDDALDYDGDSDALGKNVGDDLAEGKPTLPLIHTLQQGSAAQRAMIEQAIRVGGREGLDEIVAAVRGCGALDYTRALARQQADKALTCLKDLPPSPFREGLVLVAQAAVDRQA